MRNELNKDLKIVESQVRGCLFNNECETEYFKYSIRAKTPTGGRIEIKAHEGCAMAIVTEVSTFICTDLIRSVDENEVISVSLSSNGDHSMTGFINWRI